MRKANTTMEKTLPNGLVLRSLSAGHERDRERLVGLYHQVYRDEMGDWEVPEDDCWVDNLLHGNHPGVTGDDVWVVVDPARDDMLVSSTLLIPQVWRYETVEIGVGRPEAVLTHPDYRRRGLVRELIAVAHERSEALGHVIQGITGIGHYYRQFGYAMAVDLGDFGALPIAAVPRLKEDEKSCYTLRPAEEADLPDLIVWDDFMAPQFALSAVYTPPLWQHYLKTPGTSVQVIVDQDGHGVGYVALRRHTGSQQLRCQAYIVGERSSYLATYGDVLRGIKKHVELTYEAGDRPRYIGFDSGLPNALQTLVERSEMAHRRQKMYAWYMRASSPARLLKTIKPVLEKRLDHSGAHRYTGDLTIDFCDLTGLRVRFKDGCLAAAEDIDLMRPKEQEESDAWFPYHSFLNLVFGHRTYRDINYVLPETFASGRAEVLLNTLFPVKPSYILAL